MGGSHGIDEIALKLSKINLTWITNENKSLTCKLAFFSSRLRLMNSINGVVILGTPWLAENINIILQVYQ